MVYFVQKDFFCMMGEKYLVLDYKIFYMDDQQEIEFFEVDFQWLGLLLWDCKMFGSYYCYCCCFENLLMMFEYYLDGKVMVLVQ